MTVTTQGATTTIGTMTVAAGAGGLTNAVAGDQVSVVVTARYNDATRAGVVGSENVVLIIDATYNTKDVGDPKMITIIYTINGDNKENYLAPVTATRSGKITHKPLQT